MFIKDNNYNDARGIAVMHKNIDVQIKKWFNRTACMFPKTFYVIHVRKHFIRTELYQMFFPFKLAMWKYQSGLKFFIIIAVSNVKESFNFKIIYNYCCCYAHDRTFN